MSELYPEPQAYTQPPVNQSALQDLALKLSAVADMLDQRSQLAMQAAAQGGQQLQYVAQGFSLQGQQMADSVVAAISANARQSIEQGTAESLELLKKQLRQASESAAQSAKLINDQAEALQKAQKKILWKASLALLVGSVLAAGGTAFIAWRSLQQFKRADFAEDVLEATRSGAITRCGDALCARVGEKPNKFGPKGEYVLLEQ
jgi:hypothetical protein